MSSVYVGDAEPTIALFGDIMLDHTIEGVCCKIANEAPVPVVHFMNEKYSIGGCGNVLLNLFSLGAKRVFLFSRVANDDSGKKIQDILPNQTQNCMIIDPKYNTITKNRIYSEQKLMCRYDVEIIKPITNDQENIIIEQFKEYLENITFTSVIFSDYNKGFLTKKLCQSIISLCNERNIPTIVDPKDDYTKYIGCTVIKPNKSETKHLFKLDPDQTTYVECHRKIHEKLQCTMSVITLSGDGISAFKGANHYRVREDIKEVIDVTGAGDIVCSVLGTYYPYMVEPQTLIQIANHLASISVSHLGVYTVNHNDLIGAYKYIHNTKKMSVNNLPVFTSKTVVFTNGCFDILHSAHIELFKYCKTLGDILVVGVNSDASIRRLKGPTRPVNCLDERIKVLNAIEYIDFIVPFEEDTPANIIQSIKPYYLVKGGDYTVDNIVGKEIAKETIVFKYINGISTTNLIKVILDNHSNQKLS